MQSLEGEGKKDYAVVVHKGAVVAHEIRCALVHMPLRGQVIADGPRALLVAFRLRG